MSWKNKCLCYEWRFRVGEEEGVAEEEGGEGDSKQLTDIIDIVIDIIRFPGVAKKEGGGGNKQFTVIPEISPVSDSNIISEAAVTTDLW